MTSLRLGAIMLVMCGLSPSVQALDREAFYVGLDASHVWFREFDDDTSGYLVRVGYQPSRYYAVEVSRLAFFDMRNRFDRTTGDTVDVEIKDGSTLNLSLVGLYPLGKKLSLQGRLGVSRWNVFYDLESSAFPGVITNRKDDDTTLSLGVGLTYDLSDLIGIHGAVDYFKYQPSVSPLDDDTERVPAISLGIVIRPL